MVQWPPTVEGLLGDVKAALGRGREAVGAKSPKGWDGKAAGRIVDALVHSRDA
jgi:hypothetical protein